MRKKWKIILLTYYTDPTMPWEIQRKNAKTTHDMRPGTEGVVYPFCNCCTCHAVVLCCEAKVQVRSGLLSKKSTLAPSFLRRFWWIWKNFSSTTSCSWDTLFQGLIPYISWDKEYRNWEKTTLKSGAIYWHVKTTFTLLFYISGQTIIIILCLLLRPGECSNLFWG